MPDEDPAISANGTDPASPATGVPRRFYLRERGMLRRDHKVRRLVQRLRTNLPWLEPSDEPAARAWCELQLLAEAAYADLRDNGMLTPGGEARALVDVYTRLRKTQLQFARELGMTPAARLAIKANGTRAALDLAAALASEPE